MWWLYIKPTHVSMFALLPRSFITPEADMVWAETFSLDEHSWDERGCALLNESSIEYAQ